MRVTPTQAAPPRPAPPATQPPALGHWPAGSNQPSPLSPTPPAHLASTALSASSGGTGTGLVRSRGLRGPRTPLQLKLIMVAAILPVAFLALAVDVAADRNDRAVETVGQDSTQGITVAQDLKRNLAELDQVAVESLLRPADLQAGSFPQPYNAKRDELHGNLVTAAAEVPSGVAYHQPLSDIDYALGHYHALVGDAVNAAAAGDPAGAAVSYSQAHDVMVGTLLPAADDFDKANSYVLNDTYQRHKDDAGETIGVIVVATVVMLAAAVLIQVFLYRRFHRILNIGLLLASLLVVLYSAAVLGRMSMASSNLTEAREESFDSVHVLARARTTVVSARQAQGMYLLSLGNPEAAQNAFEAFDTESSHLFRIAEGERADVIEAASDGSTSTNAGGYLTTVLVAESPLRARVEAGEALEAFAAFLTADSDLRERVASDVSAAIEMFERSEAADELGQAIDEAQAVNQEEFDEDAAAAADATRYLRPVNLGVAAAILGLILLGLLPRLREYSA